MRLIDADAAHIYLSAAACEQIKIMPTIEVEPVKNGRWIEHDKKTWCTLCGKSNKDYKPPFCPHCGARMDGKDGENG